MTESERKLQIQRELKKVQQSSGKTINELRVILALERLAARLCAHKELAESLVFKGGFVLLKLAENSRFTRDLDALAIDMAEEKIVPMVRSALSIQMNDGLSFGEPEVVELVDQGMYGGYRVKVPFQIGALPADEGKLRKLSRVHIDIGIGDRILSPQEANEMPQMLGLDEPISWRVYPLECIFAEKLETVVARGAANSRAKDYYDLVILYERLVDPEILRDAITLTFKTRNTTVPTDFKAFLNSLDLSLVERSWRTVAMTGGVLTFEAVIGTLEDIFSRVTGVMRD